MSGYELFRQSIPGWSFLASYFMFSSIYSQKQNWGSSELLLVFVISFISSNVFGYLLGQVIRAFYILVNNRPNDTKVAVKILHEEFCSLAKESSSYMPNELRELINLTPKDLHRILWVSFANQALRDRSESYWERFYSNQAIIVSLFLGLGAALITSFESLEFMILKIIAISILSFALIVVNNKYLKICSEIENTWNKVFIARLKTVDGEKLNGLIVN